MRADVVNLIDSTTPAHFWPIKREENCDALLAQVIEVASAVDTRTEEETNISGISLGSMVLIPKATGVRLPWDDSLRIIDTREILALVDEIRLT